MDKKVVHHAFHTWKIKSIINIKAGLLIENCGFLTLPWTGILIRWNSDPGGLSVRIPKNKKGKVFHQKCCLLFFHDQLLGGVDTSLKTFISVSTNPFHRTTACRKESQGTYQELRNPILISIILSGSVYGSNFGPLSIFVVRVLVLSAAFSNETGTIQYIFCPLMN